MKKNVTIHSFRQSVGKSTLAANLAVSLALQGHRIGLVDTDFQGATAHLFFGLGDDENLGTFNDYILKRRDILETVHDLSDRLPSPVHGGKLYLVPASTRVADVMQMLRTRLELAHYTKGLASLQKKLKLDLVLVDTRAGLDENTMTAIAVANKLVLVLHPDQQDFQGTAVTVEIARKLQVPNIRLVLNDSSEALDAELVYTQLEETYHCGGGLVLAHTEQLAALASSQPFVLAYPDHPLTARIQALARQLI